MSDIRRGRPVNSRLNIPSSVENIKRESKMLQELLFFQVCGVAAYSKVIIERGENIISDVNKLIEEVFSVIQDAGTLENTINILKKSQRIKVLMRSMCGKGIYPGECEYNLPYYKDEMISESIKITLAKNASLTKNVLLLKGKVTEDLYSLCEVLKEARMSGIETYKVERFYIVALNKFTKNVISEAELTNLIYRIDKLINEIKESLNSYRAENQI